MLFEALYIVVVCSVVCIMCQIWVAASDYEDDLETAQRLVYIPLYIAVVLLTLEVRSHRDLPNQLITSRCGGVVVPRH